MFVLKQISTLSYRAIVNWYSFFLKEDLKELSCMWIIYLPIFTMKKWSEVAQLCPTLCDPVDCSLPGFSDHGIFQARVLEWVAISFSRGSSWPRDQTRVSRIVGRCFTLWATREALFTIFTIKTKKLKIFKITFNNKPITY